MLQVIENAADTFIAEVRTWIISSTRYTLDKATRRARFERKAFGISYNPVDVAFNDIAGLDMVTMRSRGQRTHSIVLRLKSGKRHWMSGDGADNTADLAHQMRQFIRLAEPTADEAAQAVSKPVRWMMRGVQIAAVVVVGLVILGKFANSAKLPECDAKEATGVVKQLYEEHAKKPVALSGVKTVAKSDDQRRCIVSIAVDGDTADTADTGYRVYLEDKKVMVRLTGLAGTGAIAPERLGQALAAEQAFNRAADAAAGGLPPRLAEGGTPALLGAIFDVPRQAKPLAYSEIDKAIDWFNRGDAIGARYVNAGLRPADVEQNPVSDATQKRMQQNVITYAPEFGRYVDFQMNILRLIADAQLAHQATGAPETSESEQFRAKMNDIRETFAQTIGSNFIAMTYDGLSDQHRAQRLAVLAQIAPTAARFLTPGQAKALREQASDTLAYFRNPQIQASAKSVIDAIAKP
jgi:hypothetical protein